MSCYQIPFGVAFKKLLIYASSVTFIGNQPHILRTALAESITKSGYAFKYSPLELTQARLRRFLPTDKYQSYGI